MWNAPHCNAIRPSRTSSVAAVDRGVPARRRTAWPARARREVGLVDLTEVGGVRVRQRARCARIHATAADVSSPPLNAIRPARPSAVWSAPST